MNSNMMWNFGSFAGSHPYTHKHTRTRDAFWCYVNQWRSNILTCTIKFYNCIVCWHEEISTKIPFLSMNVDHVWQNLHQGSMSSNTSGILMDGHDQPWPLQAEGLRKSQSGGWLELFNVGRRRLGTGLMSLGKYMRSWHKCAAKNGRLTSK